MQVKFDGQKLSIDDIIDVKKEDNDYFFDCGAHTIKVTSPDKFNLGMFTTESIPKTVPVQPQPDPTHDKDPHHYSNGRNGMTVNASTSRAYTAILDSSFFELHDDWTADNYQMLFDACKTVIKRGDGRNSAYALAGVVKKGMEEGRFLGAPASFFFYGLVEGYIKEPEKVTIHDGPARSWSEFWGKNRSPRAG